MVSERLYLDKLLLLQYIFYRVCFWWDVHEVIYMEVPFLQNQMSDILNPAPILTVKDIQQILRIGQVSAYRLVRAELFPVVRVGRCYRIPADSFFQWMNRQCQRPSEKPFVLDNSCLLAQLRNGGMIDGSPQSKR